MVPLVRKVMKQTRARILRGDTRVAWVSPLTTTAAAAIRKATGDGEALPPVEPVTMAVLPERSIFMEIPRYKCLLT
jgi:hypothetical protein